MIEMLTRGEFSFSCNIVGMKLSPEKENYNVYEIYSLQKGWM